jgi:hypothetical protein
VGGEPGKVYEGGEEDRTVDAVHEVEVEFDDFGRVLGPAGIVDYVP